MWRCCRTIEPAVRSNLVIAIGDLAFRFPNLLEPWTANMYEPLLDPDNGEHLCHSVQHCLGAWRALSQLPDCLHTWCFTLDWQPCNAVSPRVDTLCLRTGVRKNALMVLTHLILNDMMKVKGHIARMAMCLQVHPPVLIGRAVRDIPSILFTPIYHHTSMQQSNA